MIYLYKLDTATGRWGRNIAHAADDLEHTVGRGQYRVLVKSLDAEGKLSLDTSCSGSGCPEGAATCRFDDLPSAGRPSRRTR